MTPLSTSKDNQKLFRPRLKREGDGGGQFGKFNVMEEAIERNIDQIFKGL